MIVTPLDTPGNSAKFQVETKRGEFTLAMSFTLRTKIWELASSGAEQHVASELAEAIVSRHDPALPFKKIYIFAEHTCEATPEATIARIRKYGFDK